MVNQYTSKFLDSYDRDFYDWTIDNELGDPRDLWISDIDAIVRDRNDNLMLLEIKRNNYQPKPYQRRNMAIIEEIMRVGIEALGGRVEIEINGRREVHNVAFHGFKLLQLSGVKFGDSKFTVDGHELSATELLELLRFGNVDSQSDTADNISFNSCSW